MIEFDQHDRALDAIVERAVLGRAADPAKTRIAEMALDLLHPRLVRTGGQRRDIAGDQIKDVLSLYRRQVADLDSLIGNDAVVLMRPGKVEIVGEMASSGREVAADHRMRDDGATLLFRRERADERQSRALFV